MTWATDRRLDYIERCLVTHGAVQRSDLIAAFNITMSQASADLAAFLAAHPERMEYNKSRKAYLPANGKRARKIVLDDQGRLVVMVG